MAETTVCRQCGRRSDDFTVVEPLWHDGRYHQLAFDPPEGRVHRYIPFNGGYLCGPLLPPSAVPHTESTTEDTDTGDEG